MNYKKRPTQQERILALLKERGSRGVWAWEIINDLHILAYTARLWGLRQKGYNIVNKKKNLYVLETEPEQKTLWEDGKISNQMMT